MPSCFNIVLPLGVPKGIRGCFVSTDKEDDLRETQLKACKDLEDLQAETCGNLAEGDLQTRHIIVKPTDTDDKPVGSEPRPESTSTSDSVHSEQPTPSVLDVKLESETDRAAAESAAEVSTAVEDGDAEGGGDAPTSALVPAPSSDVHGMEPGSSGSRELETDVMDAVTEPGPPDTTLAIDIGTGTEVGAETLATAASASSTQSGTLVFGGALASNASIGPMAHALVISVPQSPTLRPSSPRSPKPKSPAPLSPISKSPAPKSPAPKSPAPRSPAPRSPAPRSLAPKSPAPRSPAPRSPVLRSPRTPRSPSISSSGPRSPRDSRTSGLPWYPPGPSVLDPVLSSPLRRSEYENSRPAATGSVGGGGGYATRHAPITGVKSFGGGSGGGSSRFVHRYSIAGRHTPPPPPPGIFTSASTRLALRDALYPAGGLGGSGRSVTGLAGVDFRPRWKY